MLLTKAYALQVDILNLSHFRHQLVVSVFSFFLNAVPGLSLAKDANYLSKIQQQASSFHLSGQRQWHVLLHYSPRLISNQVTSLVDDEKIFFHSAGKVDPHAELIATLAGFFNTDANDNESAQCLFPARFKWLQQQLDIDTTKLPERHCDQLEHWLDTLSVSGITLVFPVAYLNNPASMFGHTFLRLDSTTQKSSSDLLAWTVNYAANTELERGIQFAFKGLFGGYPGKFSLAPYYNRVQEYGDLENRDIWEYELNFSAQEINAMLLHLWELLAIHFDYFFIDENCSFQLLSLLEAARPGLKLSEIFRLDAIPADTVRAVIAIPGLLRQVKFRPSRRTVLLHRADKLNAQLQILAKEIAQSDITLQSLDELNLSQQQQAQILELSFDYLSYLDAEKLRLKQPVNEQQSYDLLVARNALPVTAQYPQFSEPGIRPDQGHKGNRLRFSYGYENPGHYLELEFRWAYHDLYDPDGGFIQGSQLEFFKPAFRYYPQLNRFNLDSVGLVSIISLPVHNRFINAFSWQASVDVNRQRFKDGDRPLLGSFKAGAGLNYELPSNTFFSIFGIGSIKISDKFDQYIAVGGGAEIQIQHDFTENWRIGLVADVVHYFQGITHTSYDVSLKQRYTIHRDHAMSVSLSHRNEFSNSAFGGQIAWQYYF